METVLKMIEFGALGAWLVYGYCEGIQWISNRKYKKHSTGRP